MARFIIANRLSGRTEKSAGVEALKDVESSLRGFTDVEATLILVDALGRGTQCALQGTPDRRGKVTFVYSPGLLPVEASSRPRGKGHAEGPEIPRASTAGPTVDRDTTIIESSGAVASASGPGSRRSTSAIGRIAIPVQ
jgi:hypothetical protein